MMGRQEKQKTGEKVLKAYTLQLAQSKIRKMMKEGEKLEDLNKLTENQIVKNEKPNMDLLIEILNEQSKESDSEDDDLNDYL